MKQLELPTFVQARGLTLTQPWASLVALGEKRFETRSWSTNYRGPLLIHAAQGFPAWARQLCTTEPFASALAPLLRLGPLPLGAVVATAEFVGCIGFEKGFRDPGEYLLDGIVYAPARHEGAFGDYSKGRYGFVLRNVLALRHPLPWKGAQRLWRVPASLRQAAVERSAVKGATSWN